jgi:hypothetical protein
MSNVTPFLDVTTFQSIFRPLSAQEQALANLLLTAAAAYIRNPTRCPNLDSSDPMGQLVSFQVVREAMAVPADLYGHLQYETGSDDRIESGTLAAAVDILYFTDWHRELLGISGAAGPAACGMHSGFPMPPALDYDGQLAGMRSGQGPPLVAYQSDAYPYGFFNDGWLF